MKIQRQNIEQVQQVQENCQTPLQDIDHIVYAQDQYRFINFTIYFSAALVNSLPTQAFSSMSTLISQKYGLSPVLISFNTLMFSIIHPLGSFPVGIIIDKLGMIFGIRLGGVLIIIGVWLRTKLSAQAPWYCLLGTMFIAFGNMFLMNSPTKLATQWFRVEMIPVIISIAVLGNQFSALIGSTFAGFFLNPKSQQQDIQFFLIIQALIVSIPYIPKNPPSQTAVEQEKKTKQKYFTTLKKLFQNIQYIKITLGMAFCFGTLIAFISTLNLMIKVLGYQNSGRIFSLIFTPITFAGIASTLIMSYILKKTLAYKKLCIVITTGSLISNCLLYYQLYLEQQNDFVIILHGLLVGIFFVPVMSIFISYGSEVVYPLGQGSSSGYQFAASQIFGFLFGMSISAFLDKQSKWKVYIVFILFASGLGLSIFITLSTTQDLKRSKRHEKYLSQFKKSGHFDQIKIDSSQKPDLPSSSNQSKMQKYIELKQIERQNSITFTQKNKNEKKNQELSQ